MCREGGVGVEARLIQPNPGSGASPSDVATPFSCLQTTLVFLLHQDSANWSHVFGLMAIVYDMLYKTSWIWLDLLTYDSWKGLFLSSTSFCLYLFKCLLLIGRSFCLFHLSHMKQSNHVLYAVGTPHDVNTHVPLVAEPSLILCCFSFQCTVSSPDWSMDGRSHHVVYTRSTNNVVQHQLWIKRMQQRSTKYEPRVMILVVSSVGHHMESWWHASWRTCGCGSRDQRTYYVL